MVKKFQNLMNRNHAKMIHSEATRGDALLDFFAISTSFKSNLAQVMNPGLSDQE